MTVTGDKAHLRRSVLTARRRLDAAERAASDAAIADALLPRAWSAQIVAAYIPLPDEPGTIDLLDAMSISSTVVVPLMLPSRDLDWAVWTGAADLAPAAGGGRLMRPTGPTLGATYLRAADLIVVPALSVAHSGQRLGRGGGSYDRALRRAMPTTPTVALLFDGELAATLPADEWDVPVRAVITPALGWTDLPATRQN